MKVYRDTREQKGYKFNQYTHVTVEDKKLDVGDYCLAVDATKSGGKGYQPSYVIERKSSDDFLHSITHSRDRFERELERAGEFNYRMPVIVSSPWEYFAQNQYRRDVHPNAVEGTITAHTGMYNVEYFFQRNKAKAERLCFEFLRWRYKTR